MFKFTIPVVENDEIIACSLIFVKLNNLFIFIYLSVNLNIYINILLLIYQSTPGNGNYELN